MLCLKCDPSNLDYDQNDVWRFEEKQQEISSTSTSMGDGGDCNRALYLDDDFNALYPEDKITQCAENPEEVFEQTFESGDSSKCHDCNSFPQPVPPSSLSGGSSGSLCRIIDQKTVTDRRDTSLVSLVRPTSDGVFIEKKRRKRTREEIKAEQVLP